MTQMYRLQGKKGKDKKEFYCAEDDFTAEYTKLMRDGYTISITKQEVPSVQKHK